MYSEAKERSEFMGCSCVKGNIYVAKRMTEKLSYNTL
jgi:hypothetical protein